MILEWNCQSFTELSPSRLYDILRLRSEVFVVEQECPYLDPDNKDKNSFHITGYQNDELVAYTRLLPAGLAFKEPSIGRVCTSQKVRRTGVGKQLMNYSLEKARSLFGNHAIRIGAQLYLKEFYGSLGFIPEGEIYLEDNIPHIEMLFPILEN